MSVPTDKFHYSHSLHVSTPARISGEKARELEDMHVLLEDEHDPQQHQQQHQQAQQQQQQQQYTASLFSRLRTWILSRGSRLGFLPIFFLASVSHSTPP